MVKSFFERFGESFHNYWYITAIIVFIAVISASALIYKYGTTRATIVIIVATVIIPTIAAIVINIVYRMQK